MTAVASGRTYRLSPPDRTGWMFGLSLIQLAVVAGGVVGGTLLMITVSVPAGFATMVLLAAFGTVRVHGASLLELAPQALCFVRREGRTPWLATVPTQRVRKHSFPPALDGLEVLVVERDGALVAVSFDRRGGTVAASLRVSGHQFGLVERTEQDWMVGQWGAALQAFVNERSPIVSVCWSEWAAPAGLDEHRGWLSDHLAANPLDDVRVGYERLLRESSTRAARHDVVVTVTVNIGRVRHRDTSERLTAAVDVLLGELARLGERLQAGRLVVSAPLSPAEWARAMRLRLDPPCRVALDARLRSLGEIAGGCSLDNAWPLAAASAWTAWQTDSVWHRSFVVTEWPRLDVPAGWMADLVLYAGAVRTVAVVFEPIARSKSQRSIVRDAAKIESDAAHRAEKGFRVGAHHRRARQAVEEREEELVAGYVEFTYVGIVTITAASVDELDTIQSEITQVASSIGIELRPLHGRHDVAVVATLPVARGLKPKAWT